MIIRQVKKEDYPRILYLNEDLVNFLSPLDQEDLEKLVEEAEFFQVIEVEGQVEAFLIALREGKSYTSVNYLWFSKNYESFLYIDRVVVSREYMRKGLGRKLYSYIFDREKDVDYITAEIDIEPINQVSLDFHNSFGFKEVGRQTIKNGEKTVSLQLAKIKREI